MRPFCLRSVPLALTIVVLCVIHTGAQSTISTVSNTHLRFSTGCYTCHTPTTGGQSNWLSEAEIASASSSSPARCDNCHDGLIAPEIKASVSAGNLKDHPVNVAYEPHHEDLFPIQFDGTYWVFRENPVNQSTKLRLTAGSDGRAMLTCESCHDPHAAASNHYLRDRFEGSESKFCSTCHRAQTLY